jgi:hypothetical protein
MTTPTNGSTTAITDDDGHVVATGVFRPLGDERPSGVVGVFIDGDGEHPTQALALSPVMASRLARELMAAAEKAVKS